MCLLATVTKQTLKISNFHFVKVKLHSAQHKTNRLVLRMLLKLLPADCRPSPFIIRIMFIAINLRLAAGCTCFIGEKICEAKWFAPKVRAGERKLGDFGRFDSSRASTAENINSAMAKVCKRLSRTWTANNSSLTLDIRALTRSSR